MVHRVVVHRDAVTRDVKAFEYLSLITGEITRPNPLGRPLRVLVSSGGAVITRMGEVCQPGWIYDLLAGICSR